MQENKKMKLNAEVQKMGWAQIVRNDADYSVLVNDKLGSVGKCTFCLKDGCRINACDERRDR